jgi:large subunit ribosomal protein L20
MLSDLAINEPYSFKALVDTVKRMKGVPVVTVAGPK